MLYGDEKLREMARSILPSSRRKSARVNLALAKRKSRRKMKIALKKAMQDPELELEDHVDPHAYPYREIRFAVRDRRHGDKVSHLQKWAVAYTAHMGDDPGGRLAKIRAILPDNLIGWHACTHIEWLDEFRTHNYSRWPRYRPKKPMSRERKIWLLHRTLEDKKLIAELNMDMQIVHQPVHWIYGYKEPRKIRRDPWFGEIRYEWVIDEKYEEKGPDARTLKCPHDVEDFLDDIEQAYKVRPRVRRKEVWIKKTVIRRYKDDSLYIAERRVRGRRNPEFHPEWSRALDDFLDRIDGNYFGPK